MSEDNQIKTVNIPEHELLELYQIIHRENLFGLLSEENYNNGKEMLSKLYGMELGDMTKLGLRFTIDDHLKIASDTLDMREKSTDFWKVVVRIAYIMMSIERNPLIADEIEDIKNAVK